MSRLRLVPILVILFITLAVLFGGWQAYRHYNLALPLQTTLEKIQGVQSANVSSGGKNIIVIKLGKVDDLQSTYDRISNTVTSASASNVNIQIQDNHTPALTSEYEKLQPILFEGLAKGSYTQMIQHVEAAGEKAGFDTRVTMDDKHVYIQLEKNGHYLYKIQPYTMQQGDGSA